MTIATTSLLSKQATIAGVQVPPMAIGEYLDLRNIGLDFRWPTISLGTWSWGDKTWGYEPKDFENVKAAWSASVGAGLTFFDTALVYQFSDNHYGGWFIP